MSGTQGRVSLKPPPSRDALGCLQMRRGLERPAGLGQAEVEGSELMEEWTSGRATVDVLTVFLDLFLLLYFLFV